MNKSITLSVLATTALGLCGCDRDGSDAARNSTTDRPRTTENESRTPPIPAPPAANNSARNAEDRAREDAKTPMDQSQTESDIKITAEIRRAIMDEKTMSTNAQNCKIITENGVVTLRGPVDSAAEKDAIESKARAVANVVSVTNELEVKEPQ